MSFNLILNRNNVIQQNGFYNTLQFQFINGAFTVTDDMYIQLTNAQIPYSTFNISKFLNNNTFNILWPKGGVFITYNVVIPDGFYSYDDLNDYILFYCKNNGLYLSDADGNIYNYINIRSNSTYYGVELNLSLIPSSLPVSYTNPANLQLPNISQTPRIEILNNKFSEYIGYSVGIYPPTVPQLTSYNKLSDLVPLSSSLNSIILRCNLIDNYIVSPTDILDNIAIFNTAFGSNINYTNNLMSKKVKLKKGTYNNLTITLHNEKYDLINQLDPNIVLNLLITKY